MTETVLKEIVHRAVRDSSYRAQLQSDPAGALAGFSLTAAERAAITTGDPTRLTALGIDQRMSKAFAAGVLGDASKVIIVDAGVGGSVIDEVETVRSPMWRLEQDLDTGAGGADAAVATDAETVRSPMWRVEQDLDTGAGATALEADTGTTRSPMWKVEQDLDAGASLESPASDVQITGDNTISEH